MLRFLNKGGKTRIVWDIVFYISSPIRKVLYFFSFFSCFSHVFPLDIKECFEKLDYILYSIPQLRKIFEKVFTSENKFEAFNDNEELTVILDEIFEDFKYETLRFMLEWKNTSGNIKEMMRIREISPLKSLVLKTSQISLKNSVVIIEALTTNEEEANSNLYIKEKVNYERNCAENEEIVKKTRIFAYGFPFPLNKTFNLCENYYKLAEKSIKSLTQKPQKLFSIDIPLVISDFFLFFWIFAVFLDYFNDKKHREFEFIRKLEKFDEQEGFIDFGGVFQT